MNEDTVLLVVPPSVQPRLARWLVEEGLELTPVSAEGRLPLYGIKEL